jgi:glycine cleavage system aminomethyltransferase T
VYTHWLNERGGIEADLTVTRLAENRFMVVSGAAVTNRDLDWLSRNIPDDAHCICTDVTTAWAVLGVMGPESRALVEKVTSADLSNEAFPFGTIQQVEIGCAVGNAFRVSYVGELGWELYVPSDQARHAYGVILEAGVDHGLVPAGMHALDSCRIEKKFLHFGHDIADEDTPVDAGVRFVCNFDKSIHFIGRDAVSAQLDAGKTLEKRLLQFLLEAILLCNVGGVFGVLLGFSVGNLVVIFTGFAVNVPLNWALIGVLFCSTVGLIFGLWPAIKASRLTPIEALSYE